METYNALVVDERRASIQPKSLAPLADNEVRIEVHFSSLNYKDALAVTGKGRIMRRFPMIAGIDAAGLIVESNSTQFAVGDPVLVTGYELSQTHDGGYAEYLTVPADWVVALPSGLSLSDAMSFGTAGFTAGLAMLRLIENHQSVEMGPVAVTGASGGVGSFSISFLAALGFEVVAFSRKQKNSQQYLTELGAGRVIDPGTLTFSGQPLEKSQWGGAVDTVGGELLSWLTRTVGVHGNIACCGLAGGADLNTTVMPFILRGISLLGVDSVACAMPLRKKVWESLATELKPSKLQSIVTDTIPLAEVVNIARDMLDGKTVGRYVVAIR